MININDFPERFSSKVEIVGECWIWNAAKNRAGYGVYCVYTPEAKEKKDRKRMMPAHRFSWSYINGEIPKGMFACHKCDNPSCVNPEHIFIGTQKENMADMRAKGRSAKGEKHWHRKHPEMILRGEQIGNSKLTAEQVKRIREEYKPGKPNNTSEYSLTGLAKKYGVTFQTISKIINNQRWVN